MEKNNVSVEERVKGKFVKNRVIAFDALNSFDKEKLKISL